MHNGRCPECDVDLEDRQTDVRCWRCGWAVRDVDDPRLAADLRDAISWATA